MQVLKASIKSALEETQSCVYTFTNRFRVAVEEGTTEDKVAQMLAHSLVQWADARKAIYRAAASTEQTLKNIQSDLLRGLVSNTTFLDTSRVEEYTQKQIAQQDMAMQAMYLIGLDHAAMKAVFNKVNALEFAGYAQ